MSSSAAFAESSSEASKLTDLLDNLEISPDWTEIEDSARKLANNLRNRGGPGARYKARYDLTSMHFTDEHTAIGKTRFPTALASLLKAAIGDSRIPVVRASAVLELLRVGANLCIDHSMSNLVRSMCHA